MVWSTVLFFGEEKREKSSSDFLFFANEHTNAFKKRAIEARGQPILQSEFKHDLQLTFQRF